MVHKALVVGTVIGATAIVGGVASQWNRVQPQFKVSEPNLVVLHTPSHVELAKAEAAKKSAEMQEILDKFTKRYPGQFGIVITDLTTGASASVAAEEQMISASLYKMYVGYGIYQMIDEGKITTKTKMKSGKTVGHCLDIMITISDNDCGYALGTMVGWQALDEKLVKLGLQKTKINNYGRTTDVLVGDKFTSAADVAKFTEALYRGKLLSPASTQEYIATLKADKLNTWLPSGLPKGTVIAHKTGALYNLVHDAGVVYVQNGDYVIVVMSRNWQNAAKQPPPAFGEISRQVWEYMVR